MTGNEYNTEARWTGTLLIAGVAMLLTGFLAHPENTDDTGAQVAIIADNAGLWQASHYLLAFGLAAVMAGGIISFTGRSAGYCPSAFNAGTVVTTVAVALSVPMYLIEASVVVSVAESGDVAAYEGWQALVNGFLTFLPVWFVGLGVQGFIARRNPIPWMPTWLSTAQAILCAAVFLGTAGAIWFDIAALSVAFPAMFPALLYVAWNGVALIRQTMPAKQPVAAGRPA